MPTKTTEEKTAEDKVIAARNKNLDLAIQQIAKDYGDGAIMRLGDAKRSSTSTSFPPATF